MKDWIIRYKKMLTALLIVAGIYLLYFHNIWAYKLLDVDETRYVDMASKMYHNKEFLTLYLNGEFFFEKPPLFFWIETIFFKIFNNVSEGIARIPISLQSLLTALTVYFAGAKIVSKKFGLIAAVILATSLEFIILSKIAILDMLLASCITISAFSGFMTFFTKDSQKKYFWWTFYIFSALAVMAKGLPGVIVPFGIMFCAGIYTKRFKDFFKPQYFIIGSVLFLLIVLPWHLVMLKTHGQLFFDEYIIKHHLLRFMGSKVIDRERPVYFYIVTLLWGLFPWIFSLIAIFIEKFRDFRYKPFDSLDTKGQFLALNIIGALFVLIFFSVSGTKLITYILPIYPFIAVISADYWYCKKTKLFVVCSGFMILMSAFGTPHIFNIDYKFGQDDLMEFAQIAKEQNKDIITYKTGKKYSLLYYSDRAKVLFSNDKKLLNNNAVIIVRNKDLKTLDFDYKIYRQGVKYSVITLN